MSSRAVVVEFIGKDRSVGTTLSAISKAAGVALVGGLAASIGKAKDFDLQMRQIGVQTGQTGEGIDKLRDLALKMGKDTVFSASDASSAMMELAKGGLSAAQIKAGALQNSLLLAAAGGVDMATASGTMVNAMNAFGISAEKSKSVAVALAGGANASTASVESLALALGQVGPGAKDAGLSINDTVGALAAFDNAGNKGSDAGTSLKTMLSKLVPTTDAAQSAMKNLGLKFTDAHGEMKPLTDIAGQLHDKLGGLSDAERTTALNTIFGSDARRAALVLMNEGEAGLRKYIAATKDEKAATDMANAGMSGASGTWEEFKGTIETLSIQLGTKLLPAFQSTLEFLMRNQTTVIAVAAAIGTLGAGVIIVSTAMRVWAAATAAWTAIQIVATNAQWAFNIALNANPIGLVVLAIAALVAGLVIAYKKSETFRKIVNGAFSAVADAAKWAFDWIKSHWKLILVILTGPIGIAVSVIVGHWDKIKDGASTVLDWIKGNWRKVVDFLTLPMRTAASIVAGVWDRIKDGASTVVDFIGSIPDRLSNLGSRFASAGKSLIGAFVDGMKNAAGIISGIAGNVWDTVRGLLNSAIGKINSALTFTISLPGPDISVNPPDIPYLAKGTRNFTGGLAVVGEAGPELVRLPRGADVYSNRDSRALVARHAGEGETRIVIELDGRVLWQGLLRQRRLIGKGLGLG